MQKDLSEAKILLLGNYPPDGQRSMERFAELQYGELVRKGCCVEWVRPFVIFNKFIGKSSPLAKWFGYVDKLIIFPLYLFFKCRAYDLIHICDHSNAHYLRFIPRGRTVVTCHDCLAIRAAKDEFEMVRIGKSGKMLQKYILGGLRLAKYIACDSESSRKDVDRLLDGCKPYLEVIYLGKQEIFRPLEADRVRGIVGKKLGDPIFSRYIIHVSNNNWYKNRVGLIQLYSRFLQECEDAPRLVMVGEVSEESVIEEIRVRGLQSKVSVVTGISDEELCALYNGAEFLIHPSYEEGFGWPIIEAYACGCRVVTSGRSSMAELGGEVARYADPYRIESFVQPMVDMWNEPAEERRLRVEKGFLQAAKFTNQKMLEEYSALYGKVISRANHE